MLILILLTGTFILVGFLINYLSMKLTYFALYSCPDV